MAITSKNKSKSSARPHSNGPKTKSKPKKAIARAGVGNPCDDQNGVLLCWGGSQHNVPFPTTGGPWVGVVAYNSQTGLMEWQWADLTTLCPGNVATTAAASCRPCGGGETLDTGVQSSDPPRTLFDDPAIEAIETTNS